MIIWQRVLMSDPDHAPREEEGPLDAELESQLVQILDESDDDVEAAMEAFARENPQHAAGIRRFFADFVNASEIVRAHASPAPTRVGNYRVLERLGAGGMGTVYRAEDVSLGRFVALKLLRPHYLDDAAMRQRFEREVRAVSRLDHPNICRVYEVGDDGGEPYMAMQLVDGESLAERLVGLRETRRHQEPASASAHRQDLFTRVRWIEDAARAIHAAHEAGLVHRDLKPGNLMVGASGNVMVLDFGLVQDDSEQNAGLTLSGELLGTPRYMAPEQVVPQGREVDRRTDVYALGVTLYELVTLEPPYSADTRAELFDAIRRADATPPRRHDRAIPRDLEIVIARAMDPDPHRRYLTSEAFADDLRRVREFEPIRARRAGRVLRTVRWCQRNRVAATGGSLLLIALVLTIWLATGWGEALDREREARGEVERAREAERMETAVRHFDSATAAASRGAYAAALDAFEHARESGYDDDVAISLGIIDARDALSSVGDARAELATLTERSDEELGTHAARVRLLQGYGNVSGLDPKRNATGRKQLERALELDATTDPGMLSTSDREFARALLAPNLTATRQHLQKAVDADPRHYTSRMLFGLAQLASGRPEEALESASIMKLLVPDSTNHVGLEVFAFMLLGKRAEAEAALAADEGTPEDVRAVLQLGLEVFEGARKTVEDTVFRATNPDTGRRRESALDSFVELCQQMLTSTGKMKKIIEDSDRVNEASGMQIRFPPQFWKPYTRLVFLVPQIAMGMGSRANIEPDATRPLMICTLLAQLQLSQAAKDPIGSRERALALFEEGRRNGGIAWGMPVMRRVVHMNMCGVLAGLCVVDEARRDDFRARLAAEINRSTQLSELTPGEYREYARYARDYAQDGVLLADTVVDRWKQAHADSAAPWVFEAQTRLAQGARGLAADLCRRALRLEPDHAEAKTLLAECQ